ncbi:MAG: hypothetical protein CVU03_07245 [Bacteroidetes bacterium HGW-Bacteroidetes-2]|jgi:tetratricopeptide (TPR) repeat protein|nr:MAG: hypothetical protein CVU03_07245 [Bacteroidetes bacterium HGW-Bacteroidetes-2]
MRQVIFVILLVTVIASGQSSFEKGEKFYNQEKFSQAKPLLESFFKQNPTHSKTKEYLGDIAAYYKDWDAAMTYYKDLVEENPNNADFNFKYGGSLGMKAKSINKMRAITYISDIKTYLGRATELNPRHIEAHWAMVELYMQLPAIFGGSEKMSLKCANQLLKISPVDGHLALGYIAEYNNNPNEAEKHYKKAISIGDSPHTYEKLANFYETKTNQPKKAIETREISLEKHKRNNLNYQIGKVSAIYNVELQKGLTYLKIFLENYSGKDILPKEWAYYRIAQIYKHLGEKEEAESWINKALSLKSDFKEAKEEKKMIRSL